MSQVINCILSSVSCRVTQLFGVHDANRLNFLELIHYGAFNDGNDENTYNPAEHDNVLDWYDNGIRTTVPEHPSDKELHYFDNVVHETGDFADLDACQTYIFSDNTSGNGSKLAKFIHDNKFGAIVKTGLLPGFSASKVRTWLWTYNGKELNKKQIAEMRKLQGFKECKCDD